MTCNTLRLRESLRPKWAIVFVAVGSDVRRHVASAPPDCPHRYDDLDKDDGHECQRVARQRVFGARYRSKKLGDIGEIETDNDCKQRATAAENPPAHKAVCQ